MEKHFFILSHLRCVCKGLCLNGPNGPRPRAQMNGPKWARAQGPNEWAQQGPNEWPQQGPNGPGPRAQMNGPNKAQMGPGPGPK